MIKNSGISTQALKWSRFCHFSQLSQEKKILQSEMMGGNEYKKKNR